MEHQRLLECARKLHSRFHSTYDIDKVHTKELVMKTGVFTSNEWCDNIRKHLRKKYVPRVWLDMEIRERDLFSGNLQADLNTAAEDISRAYMNTRIPPWGYLSYCDALINAGHDAVTEKMLQKCVQELKKRRKRKETHITNGKRKSEINHYTGQAYKKSTTASSKSTTNHAFILNNQHPVSHLPNSYNNCPKTSIPPQQANAHFAVPGQIPSVPNSRSHAQSYCVPQSQQGYQIMAPRPPSTNRATILPSRNPPAVTTNNPSQTNPSQHKDSTARVMTPQGPNARVHSSPMIGMAPHNNPAGQHQHTAQPQSLNRSAPAVRPSPIPSTPFSASKIVSWMHGHSKQKEKSESIDLNQVATSQLMIRANPCIGCLPEGADCTHFFYARMGMRSFSDGVDLNSLATHTDCIQFHADESCDLAFTFGWDEKLEDENSSEDEKSEDEKSEKLIKVVLRAKNCSGTIRFRNNNTDEQLADRNHSIRCTICGQKSLQRKANDMFQRFNNRIKNVGSGSTRLDLIARYEDTSLLRMQQQAGLIRTLKRKQRVELLLKRDGCIVSGKKADGLKVAMEIVNNHFEEKLKAGKLPEDEKKKYELMKSMYDTMQNYMLHDGKRSRATRYHPVVASYCVQMCIHLGRKQYEKISNIFGWPSHSRVQQLKRDVAGGTNLPWDGVCSETILALQKRAEKENWQGDQLLGALAHDSTMVKHGVATDHNNEIVGIDFTMPMDIVNQKMQEMANQLDGDAAESNATAGAPLDENLINIAKHHMILIFTLTSPDIQGTKSFVVGCINIADLDAACLSDFIDPIILFLFNGGFTVIAETGDGASENCKLWEDWGRVPLSTFIPEKILKEFQKEFPDIDFNPSKMGVRLHPVLGTPIILLQDMPHGVKRLNCNLENSSMKDHKRDLRKGKSQPANFAMILVFFLDQMKGNEFGLNKTSLTKAHFYRTPMSRMNVKYSVQMLSKRTHEMLMHARKNKTTDDFRKISRKLYPNQYKFLCDYIIKIDRFVDIVNGIGRDKTKTPFTKKNGKELQKELLGILNFFSEWKNKNDADVEMNEYNFLADATWRGLQQMILGYVVMIQVYCIGKGHTIHPRKTTSDTCEHYFARARASFGSTDTGTTHDFLNFLRNSSAAINVENSDMSLL